MFGLSYAHSRRILFWLRDSLKVKNVWEVSRGSLPTVLEKLFTCKTKVRVKIKEVRKERKSFLWNLNESRVDSYLLWLHIDHREIFIILRNIFNIHKYRKLKNVSVHTYETTRKNMQGTIMPLLIIICIVTNKKI